VPDDSLAVRHSLWGRFLQDFSPFGICTPS
jgi:hypothetical protein